MFRRLIDILVASTSLVVLLPILLCSLVVGSVQFGGCGIFTQRRSGIHGSEFLMYKFKSMLDATDSHGNLLPDNMRVTRFGSFLRATSIDELPSLFNVLRGDMTLVGPRPLLPEYTKLYSKRQARRLEVKPGVTGWAQVNGRNALSWYDKFELDVWYVEHRSYGLDLRILLATFAKVIKRENINAESGGIMPKFTGKESE